MSFGMIALFLFTVVAAGCNSNAGHVKEMKELKVIGMAYANFWHAHDGGTVNVGEFEDLLKDEILEHLRDDQCQHKGIPFTYFSYYCCADEGTFQVITWTGRNLFEEMKPALETFLNGSRSPQTVSTGFGAPFR